MSDNTLFAFCQLLDSFAEDYEATGMTCSRVNDIPGEYYYRGYCDALKFVSKTILTQVLKDA